MRENLGIPVPEPESTPPEGRTFVVVEQTTGPIEPLVVIDLGELMADLKDPEWQDFLHRAVAYRKELRAQGRLS